jgi:SPP1 gp7 family putative phage head morphogenesis protein
MSELFQFELGESDNPYRIANILRELANRPEFQERCAAASYNMVTMVQQQNMRSWREAASKGSRGNEIYRALMQQISPDNPNGIYSVISQQIAYNASLIQNIPITYSEYITEYIQEQSFKGRRASDIARDIEAGFKRNFTGNLRVLKNREGFVHWHESIQNRINLIARTEVSKAQCTLTQARAQNLGLDWYIWRTSTDRRVRHAHDEMDGVLVRWSDPPNPETLFGGHNSGNNYHAGMIYNCRCYAEPVIDIAYVDFPRRVHISGSVHSMTLIQFKNM